MTVEHEHTFRHALSTGINLFLGAGFSVFARDRRDRPLPLASVLRDELSHAFDLPATDSMSLGQLATILDSTRPDELRVFLRDRFTVHDFDDRYHLLRKLNVQCLFTTNIDDLLHKIYSGIDGKYLNDLDYRGSTLGDPCAIDAVWLHGSVQHPHGDLVLTSLDVASALQRDPTRWQVLSAAMEKRPTLFLGHSLNDTGVLQTLHPTAAAGRQKADLWAAFPPGLSASEVDYISALGFQLIHADLNAFLDYCAAFTEIADPHSPHSSSSWNTAKSFPTETIPKPGSVPNRPIIHFLSGAPPVWSDIFSHQLHRTEHHSDLRNLLLGRRNALVIGIPVCGKTTLMMQLAVDMPFSGHKLVVESVSVERADSILRRLAGEPALVFVDQCCDDIEGFLELAKAPNIVTAGFDSEYNLDVVSHLVPHSKIAVVSVTEISDRDIQAILRTLPHDRRRSAHVRPQVEGLERPSLFETVENNLVTSTLRQRYLAVLAQLERRDLRAFDLLLVNCYVHSCRVPVSLDMLLAYYGNSVRGHDDVYSIREALGALIADAPDAIVEDNQDYYTPRSTAVSEAVLNGVSPHQLRRMLLQFHERVRRHRVVRYDVFRRRAYDHKIVSRAFTNWKEGMEFYERLYRDDGGPYMKQHGALYLMRKRRFDEAFRWIDEAVTATGGRNFTIRNSHARILFEANVNRDHRDSVVKDMLFQSMAVLSDCYSSDRRKTYHAIVFADQALRLADIYGVEILRPYLQKSIAWLNEERRKYPWHRGARRMHQTAQRRLAASVR